MPAKDYAVNDFAADLARRIQGEVRTDYYSRVLYSTDASNYQIMPLAVVIPRSSEDVIATMGAAAQYGLPVLPRGGGTSLAGQCVGEAVVIDTVHLDRIIQVDAAAGWVKAEPGVVFKRLNDAMLHRRLMFGPDPASGDRAMLGGIVGNNSTGSHSLLYGMTADHIISVDVALADGSTATFSALEAGEIGRRAAADTLEGRIYRQLPALLRGSAEAIRAHLPQTWRRCGGYNLDRLLTGDIVGATPASPEPGKLPPIRLNDDRFNLARLIVGSEGTLAMVTSVTLNLVPVPACKTLAVLHFDDLHAALEAVPTLLEVEPSAIEMMDYVQMDLCRASVAWGPRLAFVQGHPQAIHFVEFYGENEAELDARLARLEAHVKAHVPGVSAIVPLRDTARQADAWAIRKAGLGLLMSLRGDAKPVAFIEDVAVPVEKLADYVRDVQQVAKEVGEVPLAMYAHASAGCLHIRPILNLKSAEGVGHMHDLQSAVADLVLKYGGAMSSEHGDGLARSWLNQRIFGAEVYEAFRAVKGIFDPDHRMNPGKVVDSPVMTEHLRYGPDYHTIPLTEVLDWSADHGFAGAVEMCNGAGVCRKPDHDTMCPSYMVTQEEEHSTRGRANLLRAAMRGLIPQEQLFGERIDQALDLCISCKACKSECPSSVDMARIKLEWQAHHYQEARPALRTRLIAHMPRLTALASRFPALANWASRSRFARAFADAALGIDARRSLPTFERAFTRRVPPSPTSARRVVLYVDTWANFNETGIARAAWDVLTAAGYEVIVPPYTCCGRTYLSKGFVADARRAASKVSATLAPYAEAGLPIIGLEPSCILTLRDEHLYLSDHPHRAAVGQAAVTFEEFAALHAAEWGDLFDWQAMRPLVLHGHCHQKALVGTGAAHRALGLVSGLVHEIDSGCCGMAGAFGYEKEHYAISKAMGERRLLDKVRGAPEAATIVAAGTSCRHQIKDFAGRQALHPAEVLAGALKRGK